MKILVVDDEVEVVDFLCNFIKRMGLIAEKATSGTQAIETFSRFRPDWVFLDVKMPDIDGLEVLKRMKEIDAGINSIMITGKSDEMSVNDALSLGARDYLIKPIDLDELRAKIQTYILNPK
ncbi:MAG: response regulator [Candidatus Omnitrophica bacterium]|nr:response regulator [Candidatus Omnitrophota bacterium]